MNVMGVYIKGMDMSPKEVRLWYVVQRYKILDAPEQKGDEVTRSFSQNPYEALKEFSKIDDDIPF